MKTKQTPQKKAYDKEYRRTKMYAIAFRLSRENDADLIDIYQSIPDKTEWFRQCLRQTGGHHDNTEDEHH